MTEKIPSTYTMEDVNNIYKLFDTWLDEKNRNVWVKRKKKLIQFFNSRLGWLIAIMQFLNEARKLL